jgi:prephenate dehydratase
LTRLGFLGPEGTFSHEALLAAGVPGTPVALPSVHEVVLAVQDGRVDRGLAPIENAMEGGVSATLDALAFDAPDVAVVGELVHPIHHCLVAGGPLALAEVQEVHSHPQGLAQCARFLRERLPHARTVAAASTADAVRSAAGTAAAIGPRAAAERYGATVLIDGIEDDPDNVTRFVWLSRDPVPDAKPTRTSVLFHGAGDDSPGWLVRCLSEFAFRGVNLTRIESRPLRSQLGHYLFHVDCAGGADEEPVAGAVAALRQHCEVVRVLGTYAAAGATVPSGHGGPDTT